MGIPTFTQGYPPDGSSLGQTKAVIRANLDGTYLTLGVDHINNNGLPGAKPAGYHTLIHQVTQTAVTTLANYNQFFSGVPGTLTIDAVTTPAIPPGGDTQLYALTGMGDYYQLTGMLSDSPGYAWAGGILFQWGYVNTTTSATVPVTFPVAYPFNIFNIQVTPVRAPATNFTTNVTVSTNATKAGFTIVNANSSATGLAYYWMAIGN
jgi:hypothetical protein